MNSRRFIALTPNPRIIRSIAGHGRASQQKRLAHVRFGSKGDERHSRATSALPPKADIAARFMSTRPNLRECPHW